MTLATTYICVDDMGRSFEFYKMLLQLEPTFYSERWITFNCGCSLALYNKKYDLELLKSSADGVFNKAYKEDVQRNTGDSKNNIVVLNFVTNDLNAEYERLKSLKIGEISDIMYVNVFVPYWYFNIKDPDGNVIEITGVYNI